MEQIKRRALGRGLEELFNIEDISYDKLEEKIIENAKEEELKEINIMHALRFADLLSKLTVKYPKNACISSSSIFFITSKSKSFISILLKSVSLVNPKCIFIYLKNIIKS